MILLLMMYIFVRVICATSSTLQKLGITCPFIPSTLIIESLRKSVSTFKGLKHDCLAMRVSQESHRSMLIGPQAGNMFSSGLNAICALSIGNDSKIRIALLAIFAHDEGIIHVVFLKGSLGIVIAVNVDLCESIVDGTTEALMCRYNLHPS